MENKWIPCSEQLPKVWEDTDGETSKDVLICAVDENYENLEMSIGFYGYYPDKKEAQGWWVSWAYGCNKFEGNVLAWQPLPERYEVPRGKMKKAILLGYIREYRQQCEDDCKGIERCEKCNQMLFDEIEEIVRRELDE